MDEALFLQGKSLFDARKYSKCIPLFQQTLQEDPGNLDARRFLASTLFRSRSYDAAIKEYEALLRFNVLDAWTYHGLGAAQAGKKMWKEAVNSYQNALQVDPSYQASYIGLGMAMTKLGNKTKYRSHWEEAKRAFEAAISLHPRQQSAKALAGLAIVEWRNPGSMEIMERTAAN
ncbi:MAG: tetratricopeptide repeat protein [Janthinobacterium lividum]